MLEALLNDYFLKYGKQIPQEVWDIPNPEDRLHAVELYIQNNLQIKLTSREELIKNYLENKNSEKIPVESFAKQRLEFIKKLLKFKTQNPILELPELVDKLVALNFSEDAAYDLMVEVYGKELGIERAVLPKYYDAIKTIDTFVKTKKLDIKISDEVLRILKIRALPAVAAVRQLSATVNEQRLAFEAAAATYTSSDEVYKLVTQYSSENFTQDQSVQELFLRHHPDSQPNAFFSSILNYGKDKVVGKVHDAAVKKFLATEVGKKIATQFVSKVSTAATTETIAAAIGAPAGPVGVVVGLVAGAVVSRSQDVLSWFKKNFKKVAVPIAGILGYGIAGTPGALVAAASSILLFYPSEILTGLGGGASFVFNALPGLVATEIVWPIVVIIISVPIAIALILFIITNSALVVPYNPEAFPFGYNSFLPGMSFDCNGAGNRVVAPGAVEKILPDDVPPREKGMCITPTEIVLHWSGGWNGVLGTYNTFASEKKASCQLATDENSSLQMQQMWEKKVEFSWCAGGTHNDYAVNIEMSGLCFSEMSGSVCAGVNTPPPESEIARTVELVCWLKKQYNINTVIGHFEIAGSGKPDPGKSFLYDTFLPRVKAVCP